MLSLASTTLNPSLTGGLRVSLQGAARIFGNGVAAFTGIDLLVPSGQFVSIVGPSGCGKSTLLRVISGLETPQQGDVSVEPAAVDNAQSKSSGLAFVFQDPQLLPWRSVIGNVALPLELRGWERRRRTTAAFAAIQRVGLQEWAERYPNQLSGGMKMRVSLARAMVTEPKLLLMDEPFAALDEITRQLLDEQLREIWLDRAMTVLFVTHSITEAAFLSQRVLVMSPRPGRFIADQLVQLPMHRDADLRGTPEFAAQTSSLYQALRDQRDAPLVGSTI